MMTFFPLQVRTPGSDYGLRRSLITPRKVSILVTFWAGFFGFLFGVFFGGGGGDFFLLFAFLLYLCIINSF